MYREKEISNFLNALITGGKADERIEKELRNCKGKTGFPEYTLMGAVWASLSDKERAAAVKRMLELKGEDSMLALASLVKGIEVYGKNKLKEVRKEAKLGRKQKAVK
ncbi:MAG: hypothetical protein QW035_02810 [Candidatus Anstonellales archaeon]